MTGIVIGTVSALLGIGGGTLTVPYLLWNRIDIRTAVGSAAACGLPIALAGAAGFALGRGGNGVTRHRPVDEPDHGQVMQGIDDIQEVIEGETVVAEQLEPCFGPGR